MSEEINNSQGDSGPAPQTAQQAEGPGKMEKAWSKIQAISQPQAHIYLKWLLGFFGFEYIIFGLYAFFYTIRFPLQSEAKAAAGVLLFLPVHIGLLLIIFGAMFFQVIITLRRNRLPLAITLALKWLAILLLLASMVFKVAPTSLWIILWLLVDLIFSVAATFLAFRSRALIYPEDESAPMDGAAGSNGSRKNVGTRIVS